MKKHRQISINGRVVFFLENNNGYYRSKGPCVIYPNGYIIYQTIDSSRHRIDGPAVIHGDGRKDYWIDDEKVPADKFFLKYGVL